MMFYEEPRIVRRWTNRECGTAEEWIQTSDGQRYKAMPGQSFTFEAPRKPSPFLAPVLNRHERRKAAKLARSAR